MLLSNFVVVCNKKQNKQTKKKTKHHLYELFHCVCWVFFQVHNIICNNFILTDSLSTRFGDKFNSFLGRRLQKTGISSSNAEKGKSIMKIEVLLESKVPVQKTGVDSLGDPGKNTKYTPQSYCTNW